MIRFMLLLWAGAIVATLIAVMTTTGCAPTYRPKAPIAAAASWDGTEQNSGLIGFDAATKKWIITPHARDRYNELMARYGTNFLPAVKPGDGITATASNVFLIDSQHLADFASANRWRKSGK